jgi:hypothetical protein
VPFLGDGTDTIVERLQGIDPLDICPTPPYALNPSIGQMEIFHTDLFGGTFESCLGNLADPAGVFGTLGVAGGGVYADAIFTVVGGDPSNPLDVLFSAPAPRLAVCGASRGRWGHSGRGAVLLADRVGEARRGRAPSLSG